MTNVTAPDGSRCAASVTANPVSVTPDGGTVNVTVSAERDCTWSARSDASWLSVRTTSGQGEGTFTATAARNEQPSPRSASLTVNDQRLTITQQPRPCDLGLQGPSGIIPANGGTGTVRVTTIGGCTWTATSSAPWLLIQTSSGSGSADIRFDVLANPGSAREATITVSDESVVITQAAAVTAPVCSFAIDRQMQEFPVSGGQGTVTVSTQPECAWTATGGTNWVALLSGAGTGPGEARYQVSPNTTTEARQTTLTIAGRVHTVTQPGLSCTYSISASSATFTASGGTGALQVNTLGGCAWTASSNAGWIVVGTAAGSGPGQIAYQVLPNALPTDRTGTIAVGGQTHTVTQAGAAPPCTYSLDPASRSFTADAATGTVTVNTQGSCGWTAASSVPWITIASGSTSGTGTAQISYSVAGNTASTERSGTVTIGGQTHTVTQSGAAPVCTYTIDPASRTFAAAGGPGTVSVTTGASCAWTAATSVPWIAVSMGSSAGTGSATVAYTVAQNTTTAERAGSITIGGQTHTVTQSAAAPACTYGITPEFRTFGSAGGTGTITLTTEPACTWTAVSDSGWVVVTNQSGTGSAVIAYTVSASGGTRSATITVGNQVHRITQTSMAP